MLLKSRRRMYGFKGLWRWTHHFPLIIWLSLLPTALGYFLGDTKAVLNGCEDHWTLQDRATVPQLYQMTVCFHIRVVVPGAWVAFSYSSVYAPRPDLGLEGDDGALYGWLLRVRHRFPVRLSPAQWHRVCLRRDVHGNSFSLEVDGKMVAERTAIAPAIPPAGSLWLGCRPRDQTPGANVGAVELYLFRMWADLGEHGRCEDGTVIGWNAEYWGVTSPKARQRDPNLMCDHRRLRREARVYRSITESSVGLSAPTASSPVTSTPDTQMNNQTSTLTAVPATTGTTHSQPVLVSPVTSDHTVAADAMSPPVTSPLSSDSSPAHQIPSAQVFSSTAPLANQTTPSGSANCDISQLCSNDTAYFWMSISVKDNGGNKTEQDVKDLVSHAFDCSGSSTGVCQGGNQLQVVEVSCGVKSNISNTTCSVLLLLSHAVLPCELQAAGVSALQQSQQIQATIIGAVERVGRTVCENVEPSGGGFVRCTSTLPLNDICQSNKQSTLTCTPIDSNPNPVPQPQPNTCSGETPLFCDCSAFCNSASQFFAMRINIIKTSVDISYLQHLMSNLWQVAQCTSVSASTCEDYVKILNLYQAVHLECQGTGERLYSCMVIVEMSGLVNECSLSSLLQQLINGDPDITTDIALTRIMVCGPPGLSVSTLLASNLTWASSDLLSSDICSPDPTMFKCEPNQMLAVLLPNNCPLVPPTTNQTTTQRTKTNFTTPAEATPTSVTNNTTPIYTRAESTPVTPQTNASQGSAEPNMTTPLTTFNSTQSSTPQPLLQTSQNTTVIVSDSTIAQYTESDNTSLLTPTKTVLQDATTAQQNTTTHDTASPNSTTVYNVTTTDPFTPSSNEFKLYNVTTATLTSNTTGYNVSTVESFTPSQNDTTVYSVTTTGPLIPSANETKFHNVTTVAPFSNTTDYNVTSTEPLTPYPNVTTVKPFNNTTEYNVSTAEPLTPYPNVTTVYNVTTVTPFNNTTEYNVTTVTPFSNTTEYNVSTAEPFTVYPNTTTVYNATTALGNYTTAYNATTTTNNNTTQEDVTAITVSPNNITTTPLAETQQNTTVAYDNTSVSTTALQANETLTTASNMTMDNSTSDTDNATRPTTAPLNNQTVSVTYNSTTTANTTGPTSNTTVTANISPSVNATVSNLTTDLPLTTQQPGVNLTTTAANVSLEHITTTLPSSTTYGPVPTQVSTTAAEVPSTSTTPLQATTGTSTSTTVTSTGTTIGAQEQLANELLTKSQNASRLNSTEVTQLVDQLEKLLDGPSVSQTIGQKTINIISNLMNASPAALLASSNRITHMVDNLGVKVDVSGGTGVLSSSSLVLAVRTVDGSNFPEISVKIYNTDNVQLSAHSRSRFKRSGSAMGSVFLPSSLTSGLHPVQQQQANRVQFTFYSKSSLFQDSTLNNKTLVSPILSSSVSNLSISNLTNNIIFTIQNINPVNDNFTASCAFWDFTLNGGGGGWSSFGCFVVNVTAEETTCSCNHLTSFAILLDLSRAGIIDRQQGQILTFITYIGCGISAIFLAITLLTYLLFEKLMRDIPAKILVQLCISLLFLNLVFLLDGWLALYPAVGLCISTAFFLHYFLLTTFTWAGLEALHMYLSIVQVFTPYFSSYMLKFSLVGWGIPLLVVIIIISVDKNNYGLVTYGKYTDGTSDDFCWLRNDIAFYVGVVAYFLLIFVLCFVVFIVVMVQLSRIKKQNPHNQSPNRGVMTDLRSVAGLVVLLGLTWGFALFAWGPLYLPFVYLFTIFNSLQGFFIFVFHCAVKENVRRQWRTYLCCGKLRLAENSEWSRTATQNNRNTSVTTANTSAPQLTSRSSSVISDATNSSSSVFADSGISDGSNSDVVLNELHRRNLSQRGESI